MKKFIAIIIITVFTIGLTAPIASVAASPDTEFFLLGRPAPVSIAITAPADGDTVSGNVQIVISCDKLPTLSIDGVEIGKGYVWDWDTTASADGLHTITANYKASVDEITVTVDNGGAPPPDNPPVVTITSPANGATVSGTVSITTDVSDEDTLTADIYIDGTFVGAGSYSWDTTAYADGSYTIFADATDSASQTGSDQITVTVDNTVEPPPPPPTGNMPWWNDAIDVEKVHAAGITGKNTVVVIIDTGTVSNYLDFFPATSFLTDYCWSQTKSLGIDSVDWNQDSEGHGTACAATVIGYDLNGDWVTGVAPDAKIVSIRTIYWIGGVGRNRITADQMLNAWADAIDYAIDLHTGALSGYNMIISMSLGYSGTNTNLGAAINAAEAAGIVVATSAGNDGHSSATSGYPAEYSATTSVAAAAWSGYQDAYGINGIFGDIPEDDFSGLLIADFSSGGKVDITGIGENLVLPQEDGYYYMSGTSFSCPQVAGVYALMFEAHGGQSVQWMEDTMGNSAYWGSGMTSFVWGSGFVQADAACGI
jgi:hypothetical protein